MCRDTVRSFSMASVKRLNRAGLSFSQQGFQLVKDSFDWVEIGNQGLQITLELTLFHGHLIVMKQGVQDAKKVQPQAAISGAISTANDRFSCYRAQSA